MVNSNASLDTALSALSNRALAIVPRFTIGRIVALGQQRVTNLRRRKISDRWPNDLHRGLPSVAGSVPLTFRLSGRIALAEARFRAAHLAADLADVRADLSLPQGERNLLVRESSFRHLDTLSLPKCARNFAVRTDQFQGSRPPCRSRSSKAKIRQIQLIDKEINDLEPRDPRRSNPRDDPEREPSVRAQHP